MMGIDQTINAYRIQMENQKLPRKRQKTI
jgi:hypothetical protein